jgi:ATP-dependent RNA helicase DeaD
MVATDLAARGIDISDLTHVINYSLPEDPAVYLHRVGRTGRIGKKGVGLNLISGKELATFTALEKKYGITFEKRTMPTPEAALNMWTERHVKELKEAASGSIYEGYLPLAGAIKARPDADALIAFLMRSFFSYRRRDKARHHGEESHAEAPRREKDRDRERPPREHRDRDRGDRPEREKGTRRERPARFERRDREDRRDEPTQPETHAVEKTAAPPSGGDGAGAKRPSDREIFEAMKAGKPIPITVEPSSGGTEPDGSAGVGRRERRPRRGPANDNVRAAEPGQARLWVNLGRAGGLDEGGVQKALEDAGAPAGKVAHVEVLNAFSFVFVPEAEVAAFEGVSGKKHGERPIKVERAKK